MKSTSTTWKRLAVAVAIASLPSVSHAIDVTNGDNDIIYPVTIEGNDCSGVFGQGFDNCKIPEAYDPDQSPIIIKFNTFEEEGVLFPTPPSALIQINSIFASITGEEFTFDCGQDADCRTGTWTYKPGANDPVISFYVAKGGPNFNLFNVDPVPAAGTTQSGAWSTPLRAGLSHISFYDTDGDGPDVPVPEPGTLALLAAGLLGLGAAARRRRA